MQLLTIISIASYTELATRYCMYNMFLGTGKHAIQVWIDLGILTKKHFIEIEQMVRRYHLVLQGLQPPSGETGLSFSLLFALRVFFLPITQDAGIYKLVTYSVLILLLLIP